MKWIISILFSDSHSLLLSLSHTCVTDSHSLSHLCPLGCHSALAAYRSLATPFSQHHLGTLFFKPSCLRKHINSGAIQFVHSEIQKWIFCCIFGSSLGSWTTSWPRRSTPSAMPVSTLRSPAIISCSPATANRGSYPTASHSRSPTTSFAVQHSFAWVIQSIASKD